MVLTQVSMSRSGRMLFVGTNTGTVRAMKFPLTVPGEWQEHQAHTGAITKVYTIYRDYFMVGECIRFLITSCEESLDERVSAANE